MFMISIIIGDHRLDYLGSVRSMPCGVARAGLDINSEILIRARHFIRYRASVIGFIPKKPTTLIGFKFTAMVISV